jgi:CheY-like chemotaxis protein
MTPVIAPQTDQGPLDGEEEPHVLIVIKDAANRCQVESQLLEAGFRVTTAGAYGIVEVLLEHSTELDLLVTSQSFGEMGHFGLPQLARSAQPDLPILVLEFDAARGDGVLNAVRDAIRRWPRRGRPERKLH